ncbi:MAG: cell division protein FtsQ/DivIB [Rickettsiales bacterium]
MRNKYLSFLNIFALLSFFLLVFYLYYNFTYFKSLLKESINKQGFKVKEIHVNQLEYIDLAEIIDNLDFKNGDDIFALNLKQNQQRLASNLWVESVAIKIKYPDIVEINIKEKKAEFILFTEGKYYIIDAKGEIIKNLPATDVKNFADFIILSGVNAKLYTANLLEFIRKDKVIYNYIAEILRISDQRWNIKFVNNMVVKLPQQDPTSAWNLFLELNNQIRFFDNKIKSIDLRVKDRLFLELDLNNPKNLKIIEEIG